MLRPMEPLPPVFKTKSFCSCCCILQRRSCPSKKRKKNLGVAVCTFQWWHHEDAHIKSPKLGFPLVAANDESQVTTIVCLGCLQASWFLPELHVSRAYSHAKKHTKFSLPLLCKLSLSDFYCGLTFGVSCKMGIPIIVILPCHHKLGCQN